MKKLKYILPLLIILIMTGCGSPKMQLERAILKMKNMKSATVDIKADMGVPVMGASLNISTNITGDIVNLNDKNNIKTHLNTNFKLLFNVNTESYSYIKDGYAYNYTKSNNKWEYTKTKLEDNKKSISKEDVITILETFKEVKKLDSDKKGYTKLLVTLDKDSINELYKKYANKEDSKKISIEKDVKATIYLKDGYISIIDMDLTDVIKSDNSNTTAHITISLTNINKVKDFDIPSEVLESATEDKD